MKEGLRKGNVKKKMEKDLKCKMLLEVRAHNDALISITRKALKSNSMYGNSKS